MTRLYCCTDKSSLNSDHDHMLFIFGLFNGAFSAIYNFELKDDRWIMTWKVFGRMRSWPDTRYYPGICLEGLRKTTNELRIVGVRAEIWTWVLRNVKQECWPLDHNVQLSWSWSWCSPLSFVLRGWRGKCSSATACWLAMSRGLHMSIFILITEIKTMIRGRKRWA
jgi:hypothetical protein